MFSVGCFGVNKAGSNLKTRTTTPLLHASSSMKRALLLALMALVSSNHLVLVTAEYRFAIMAKSTQNTFFFPVREGCKAQAALYEDVTCDWVGTEQEDPTGQGQADAIDELVNMRLNGTNVYDGLAISAVKGYMLQDPIDRALKSGMSVICFDSDAEMTSRQAYVGTDNDAFGEQLARVLLQLRPNGGLYSMMTFAGPNLDQRVAGIRRTLVGTTWEEMPDSLLYQGGDEDRAMDQIEELKKNHPELKAIIPTYGGPMNEALRWRPFVDGNPDLTIVVADAMPHQVDLMNKGYADGLVGQLPYQSGQVCIDTLLKLQKEGNPPRPVNDQIFGTNLSLLLRIPLVLPSLTVDKNYLGNLAIMGYTFFAILLVGSFAVAGWVVWNRKNQVVKAAQPIFLILIDCGVVLMSSAIIPMTIDDQHHTQRACNIACNCAPWFFSCGFCLTFAALFSKLWRIDKVLRASLSCRRKVVTVKDMLIPLVALLSLNIIILTCWAAVAPLQYKRQYHEGTDPWNRKISSYGSCVSDSNISSDPFLALLAIVNLNALLIANVQAYRTRKIKTEFSESKYIAIVVASMAQAGFVGVPLLFLVEDEPQIIFVVLVMLIFVTCTAILSLIFIPKILKSKDVAEQESQGMAVSITPTLQTVSSLRGSSIAFPNATIGGISTSFQVRRQPCAPSSVIAQPSSALTSSTATSSTFQRGRKDRDPAIATESDEETGRTHQLQEISEGKRAE